MKKAIFPGSLDPITNGHYDIIKQEISLFDEVIVAIGVNAEKKYMFSLEDRKRFVEEAFADEPKVKVITYAGLTIDLCKKEKAEFILRGLRNPADFEFEKANAHNNTAINAQVETVFFLASAETSFVTSTMVRELLRNGADVGHLI